MRHTDPEPGFASRLSRPDPTVRRLTPREQDVARLAADGLKDLVIARRLGLSLATVKNYMLRVQRRLDLDSREAVVTWITARVSPDEPGRRLRRMVDEHSA